MLGTEFGLMLQEPVASSMLPAAQNAAASSSHDCERSLLAQQATVCARDGMLPARQRLLPHAAIIQQA